MDIKLNMSRLDKVIINIITKSSFYLYYYIIYTFFICDIYFIYIILIIYIYRYLTI